MVTTLDKEASDRFWSKVFPGPTPGSCWVWHGPTDGHGYGMFYVSKVGTRRAHRVAFESIHGPVPDGTVFLHKCDNPPCVRPDHLRMGTRAENNADRDTKGRHWSHAGEAHHAAKLTEGDVAAIRKSTEKARDLAAQYGVSQAHIYRIRSHQSWKQATA